MVNKIKLRVEQIEEVPKEVMKVVYNQLKKGRRYFGSSGASLTHQLALDSEELRNQGFNTKQVNIGLNGERKTTSVLKEWIKDKPSAVLIDSIHLEGVGSKEKTLEDGIVTGGDTDHIICFGNTVIMIDSKAWSEKKRYIVQENGEVWRSGRPFGGGRVNIVKASYLWKKAISSIPINIHNFICITTDRSNIITRNRNWWSANFKLLTYANLNEWLDKIWEMYSNPEDKTFINVGLVAYAAMHCVEPYDELKEIFPDLIHLVR